MKTTQIVSNQNSKLLLSIVFGFSIGFVIVHLLDGFEVINDYNVRRVIRYTGKI
jgi:hypothetical protein